jgi:hypothetical protein
MRLSLSPNTLERHHAFLARSPVDQPLIGSWLFGFYVPELYPRVAATLTPGPVRPQDIHVEPFLEDIDALCQAYRQLGDDYPFAAGALPSVPWMEAIMGCPLFYSGTSLWAEPCIPTWDAYSSEPSLEAQLWTEKLLELLAALVRHSQGRFPCTPTLMRGVADLCAAMRGGNNLVFDLFESPAPVVRLADRCADALIRIGQAQLALIPPSDNGYLVGCAGLRCWFPEKGLWLQDDAVSILSPRFFREFFLPPLQRVASQFPCVAFHLHGNQLWPVDVLLELDDIDVLNLNFDLGASGLEDKLVPTWRKIQARKPCIAFGHLTLDELARVRDQLSPVGLSLQAVAPTLREGQSFRDRIRRPTTTSPGP